MEPVDSSLPELSTATVGLVGGGLLAGAIVALVLMRRRYKPTWMLLPLLASVAAHPASEHLAGLLLCLGLGGVVAGGLRQRAEIRAGGDLLQLAEARIGMLDALRAWHARGAVASGRVVDDRGLLLGIGDRGPVRIPTGTHGGTHTLVVGATGAGKTVTQAWIATNLVRSGMGAIIVDPKGDVTLRSALADAADDAGKPLRAWTPAGGAVYNPYARGADSEIVDKLLAGEVYTEPHYLRQAQRYLGHLVTALRVTGTPVSLASIVDHYDRDSLELLSRHMNGQGSLLERYLTGLSAEQEKQLKGTLDRLAILHEGDLGRWLDPATPGEVIDLDRVIADREVAYFRLDADRHPLHAQMLATAIVQDLITLTAERQTDPIPTVIVLDEFGALSAEHVTRLFGRGRSAGLSLVLGTQELADLSTTGDGLLERILGNVETVIAHRQNVPQSAETIAGVAGTYGVWTTTRRTDHLGALPEGTRTRERQYRIHPDDIKHLQRGQAAVLVPSGGAQITSVFPVRSMVQ